VIDHLRASAIGGKEKAKATFVVRTDRRFSGEGHTLSSIVRKKGESWRDCALRYARPHNLESQAAEIFDAAVARGESDGAAAFLACEDLEITEQLPTPLDMPEPKRLDS
jgi:hypothetical protein